jgi:hypothetical protein
LINNRQGGRRRGRGGQGGGRNLGGQPGNRQDNRQRGNAAQLLEKYKSMARDAQLSGDRVQTEYYLRYEDHYFRVLSENRSRFEEQNPRRQRDDEMDGDESDEEMFDAGEETPADERPARAERPERPQRQERGERFNRGPRRDDRVREAAETDEGESNEGRGNSGGETIPFDALPPAIGRDDGETKAAGEEPRRPRRRARTPRPTEGEDEIAPAA